MEWIKTTERSPEMTEPSTFYNDETNAYEVLTENSHATVLAYHPDMGVFKARYDGRWAEISSISIKGDIKPTHWMPLPELPIN